MLPFSVCIHVTQAGGLQSSPGNEHALSVQDVEALLPLLKGQLLLRGAQAAAKAGQLDVAGSLLDVRSRASDRSSGRLQARTACLLWLAPLKSALRCQDTNAYCTSVLLRASTISWAYRAHHAVWLLACRGELCPALIADLPVVMCCLQTLIGFPAAEQLPTLLVELMVTTGQLRDQPGCPREMEALQQVLSVSACCEHIGRAARATAHAPSPLGGIPPSFLSTLSRSGDARFGCSSWSADTPAMLMPRESMVCPCGYWQRPWPAGQRPWLLWRSAVAHQVSAGHTAG